MCRLLEEKNMNCFFKLVYNSFRSLLQMHQVDSKTTIVDHTDAARCSKLRDSCITAHLVRLWNPTEHQGSNSKLTESGRD
jgi:hypothetical protein